MPRPTDRTSLLAAATTECDALRARLDAVDPALLEDITWQADIEDRSRNPRDVVTHLHAWHLMVMSWYVDGEAGLTPQIPAPGRTWREIPAVNDEIWHRFERTSWAEADRLWQESHHQVMALIEQLSDARLFTRGDPAWTKGTTLGSYFTSATSSHYVWGRKILRQILRARG